GNGECGQSDTGTGAGRLVHLAVHESSLIKNAGLLHFHPEVVPFTGTFADARKDGVATMLLGDVVDEFHDQNGLADTGTAEQTDLAASGVWSEQIDNLDAGRERFNLC